MPFPTARPPHIRRRYIEDRLTTTLQRAAFDKLVWPLNGARWKSGEGGVTADGLRGKFRLWTDAQIIAFCQNTAEEYERRRAHETGAE